MADRSGPLASVVLLAALALALAACNVATDVGSTCEQGSCPAVSALCQDARQQLPERCSGRSCDPANFPPDQQACSQCNDLRLERNVRSPIAPCACAYCAAQLQACFASAGHEPDGDALRDQNCQAIVECGWASACEGSDCYCGTGVDRDTCLKDANDGHPRGLCASVIEAAVECDPDMPRGNCVFANQLTAGSVLSRATDIAKCVTGDPLVQGDVIVPMCPVELLNKP